MSYSSAPKPRPSSQLTPQQVLTALRQPSAIAVLASIAVHGVLAVMLPLLPMQSEEPKRPRPVKVVALTPAEQGRLGLGTGNGFGNGNGNGNGLRSSNPLPDLSFLQPSYPLPSPNPLYSIPPSELPVEPLDTYPVETDRQSSTTDSSRKTPQTKPKPSDKPVTDGGNGGQLAAVCPTPPDDRPACKEKAAREKAEAEARLKAEKEKAEKEAQLRAKYAPISPTPPTEEQVLLTYKNKLIKFTDSAQKLAGGGDFKSETRGHTPIKLSSEACRYVTGEPRAHLGAIVKPDGTSDEILILTSSNYAVLDQLALESVAEQIKKLDTSSKVRAFEYPFSFSCPSSPPAS